MKEILTKNKTKTKRSFLVKKENKSNHLFRLLTGVEYNKDTIIEDQNIINDLVERSKQGDGKSISRLFESNLALIFYVVGITIRARGFLPPNIQPEDLVMEGIMIFLKTIPKYKHGRAKFSSYLCNRLKGGIYRFLDNNVNHLHVPVHTQVRLRKMKKKARANGGDSVPEIIGVSCEIPCSLDDYYDAIPCISREKQEDADILLEKKDIIRRVLKEEELLKKLSFEEIKLLEMRFGLTGEPQSLKKIAQSFDPPLTRECIRLREKKILRKVRFFIKKNFPELVIS